MAVVVVLAVGEVVLVVVADEVVQGEAVMRGDEVDRGPGLAPALVEELGRGGEAGGEIGQLVLAADPVFADVVAVAVVPFRPARREAPDLIAAGAAVPGLGDELDLGEHRVLPAGIEEAAALVEAVVLAREDGAEVEAEAVDVHVLDPVAQAVGDHLQHARVRQVQRVPGAGVVDVVARLVLEQAVVRVVVDALEGEGRAEMVAFGGVVVDDVEDHLELVAVEVVDHLLELGEGEVVDAGEAAVRREEAERVVAPVVREALVQQVVVVDEDVDRHQLDGGDAERLDVVDDVGLDQAAERALEQVRHPGMLLGEAAHVHLVDQRLVEGRAQRLVVAPGEGRIDDPGLHHVLGAVALVVGRVVPALHLVAEDRRVPGQLALERLGVGVEHQLVGVEAVAAGGIVGAMDAVAVDRAGRASGR